MARSSKGKKRTVVRIAYLRRRDGDNCWICGLVMRFDRDFGGGGKKGPGRLNATVDHIIPRSAGGTYARSNLALAHSSCNSGRHHYNPDELREDIARAVRAWLGGPMATSRSQAYVVALDARMAA